MEQVLLMYASEGSNWSTILFHASKIQKCESINPYWLNARLVVLCPRKYMQLTYSKDVFIREVDITQKRTGYRRRHDANQSLR